MSQLKSQIKPFDISKWEVKKAWEEVRANRGAPGVDGQSIEDFEKDLRGNLRVIHCSELREYSTILARRVDISDGPLRERIGFADSTSRERTATCTIPPACTRTRFSMCAR